MTRKIKLINYEYSAFKFWHLFSKRRTITSLIWLKENRPEIYKNTHKFGHLNTYVNYKLTGNWAIDPVNASMMGLYETTNWVGWSEEICEAFEIDKEKLPPIKYSGKTTGGLCNKIAE